MNTSEMNQTHGGDEIPAGSFHGGDEIPAGSFHG